jgi:putative flavoprotein involved in K+ transport
MGHGCAGRCGTEHAADIANDCRFGFDLCEQYLRRGSGYYIDVGAAELIANGSVKLKSRVDVKEIREHSVLFSDGSALPADMIIYATGYRSMNTWIAKLIDQKTADRVGKCWGLGSGTPKDPGPWEGELRNMYKPTNQENLWMFGGNLLATTTFAAMPHNPSSHSY